MEAYRRIEGRCHCGNIHYVVELPWGGEKLPVRACSCSFCQMHGGVYTSDPNGKLRVTIEDPMLIHKYRFGTETADFHICRHCGVVPIVTSEIQGKAYAVVNVNTFLGIDSSELDREISNFDGETTGDRLDRRGERWIPEVEVITS